MKSSTRTRSAAEGAAPRASRGSHSGIIHSLWMVVVLVLAPGWTACSPAPRSDDADQSDVGSGGTPGGPIIPGQTGPCPAGQVVCAGMCVDPLVNSLHCGGCGLACPAGTQCVAGSCGTQCGPGQQLCNGACINVLTDSLNCGACGLACPGGNQCVAGACTVQCAQGQQLCGGVCTTVLSDAQNCGACGNACPAGQLCDNGICSVSCSGVLCNEALGPVCVDTATNPAHCGMCGNACLAGYSCTAGQCSLVCAADRVACAGQCVDPLNDPLNCGACGIQCPAGVPCVGGSCGCTGTLLLCNGQCVDPAVDPNHCGGCNVSCGAAGLCSAGVCQCATGEVRCDGVCVDTATNAAHCGACGVVCAVGQVCSAGSCTNAGCPANTVQCGTDCVDTLTNRAHCGGCDLACAEGLVCVGGACACPSGTALCNDTCIDISSHSEHCGACNSPCPGGAVCTQGVCECPAGTSECAGACISLSDNDAHCGACNAACPPAQSCVGTTCTCPNGEMLCDQTCVDTQSSNEHCGGCGTTCVGGQYCSNGTCECEPPLVACGQLCVDTQTSTEHCGACDAPCATDRTCIDGLCNGVVGDGPDDCGGEAHSVTVDRIAVYQAVEVDVMDAGSPIGDSQRNADLVQGRDAVFRVFVTLESGWTPREVSVRLHLTTGGTENTLYTRTTLNADSEQSDLASTVQIEADGDLIGPDTAYAIEIVECVAGPGGTVASPRFPSEGTTSLDASPTGGLAIAFVPVQVDSWSPDTSEGALQVYRDYLQAMYPVTEVTTSVVDSVTTSSGFDWSVVLDQVRDRRAADSPTDDVYYYGLIRPAETLRDYCRGGCTTGMGYVTGESGWSADYRVACGVAFADEQSASTMAHEVGHNHGRDHTPCGVSGDANYPYPDGAIGSWGYDARTGSLLDPDDYADIMGYCSPVWVSDWTYQAFADRVAAVNGVTAQSYVAASGATERWHVLLLGPAGAHWGIPYRTAKPAVGTSASARVLAEDGSAITSITVYATATSLPDVHSYLVPPPRVGWHSIEISGGTPVAFP